MGAAAVAYVELTQIGRAPHPLRVRAERQPCGLRPCPLIAATRANLELVKIAVRAKAPVRLLTAIDRTVDGRWRARAGRAPRRAVDRSGLHRGASRCGRMVPRQPRRPAATSARRAEIGARHRPRAVSRLALGARRSARSRGYRRRSRRRRSGWPRAARCRASLPTARCPTTLADACESLPADAPAPAWTRVSTPRSPKNCRSWPATAASLRKGHDASARRNPRAARRCAQA